MPKIIAFILLQLFLEINRLILANSWRNSTTTTSYVWQEYALNQHESATLRSTAVEEASKYDIFGHIVRTWRNLCGLM